MKRLLLSLGAAGALLTGALRADDFTDGNAAFERGDFPAAVTAYEKAAAKPQAGANVFYNLGNAHFRAGEPGRAILSYERALLLAPRHPEAAANLAVVRRQTGTLPPEPSWLLRPIIALGSNGLTLLLCAGGWLLLAGAGLSLLPDRRTAAAAATGAGLLLALGSGLSLGLVGSGSRSADRFIVTAPKGARATFAPAGNARTVANLAAGTEIRLLQERVPWIYIELADGARGWLPATEAEAVVPRS